MDRQLERIDQRFGEMNQRIEGLHTRFDNMQQGIMIVGGGLVCSLIATIGGLFVSLN
jgi:biopolymer transport protein ExbB/TolQ